MHESAIPHSLTYSGLVTLSMWLASRKIVDSESLSPLLKHTDDALYQAKRSGRDRISGPQDGSQVEAS